MRSSKRIVYAVVLPVIITCLISGSVVAYAAMAMKEEKVNLFQIGNFQTKVEEVFSEPTVIVPNKSVAKKVTIVNTGTVNQFVRVMLHPEIRITNGESIQLLPSKIGEQVILNFNGAGSIWKLGEDGYYYYLYVLKPGDANASETLFSNVKLKKDLPQKYHQAEFSLLIKVEAINCAEGAYRDAWWQGTVPNSKDLQDIDKQLAEKTH